MGDRVRFPKYNVVSIRLSDTELALLETCRHGKTRQEYLHGIIMSALMREEK